MYHFWSVLVISIFFGPSLFTENSGLKTWSYQNFRPSPVSVQNNSLRSPIFEVRKLAKYSDNRKVRVPLTICRGLLCSPSPSSFFDGTGVRTHNRGLGREPSNFKTMYHLCDPTLVITLLLHFMVWRHLWTNNWVANMESHHGEYVKKKFFFTMPFEAHLIKET